MCRIVNLLNGMRSDDDQTRTFSLPVSDTPLLTAHYAEELILRIMTPDIGAVNLSAV